MERVLITGGIKSGKSSYVLKRTSFFDKKLFIATAEPFDEGMRKRIKNHKKEREGLGYDLFEEPIEIYKIIKEKSHKYDVVVIDCITVWLNNLFFYKKNIEVELENLIYALENVNSNIFVITNEVGSGIISVKKNIRDYIDSLGMINAKMASICEEVVLMCCGLPVKIKGGKNT